VHEPASEAAVATELSKLLAILGEADPSPIAELASAPVTQSMLAEMVAWNARPAALLVARRRVRMPRRP
jgi:hypothetical protein